MPHIVIEYSANLEPGLDPVALVAVAHAAAAGTGVFKLGGVRTRAERRDVFRVADGDPANGFVSVSVRIGIGRSPETRRALGQAIFDAVAGEIDRALPSATLALSLEVGEIDETAMFRRNGLHAKLIPQAEGAS